MGGKNMWAKVSGFLQKCAEFLLLICWHSFLKLIQYNTGCITYC